MLPYKYHLGSGLKFGQACPTITRDRHNVVGLVSRWKHT